MLDIALVEHQGAIDMALDGSLNIDTTKSFERILKNKVLSAKINVVGVNMNNVQKIDSSGMGVLIKMLNLCKNENKKVIIHGVSPAIKNIFTMARLESIFTLMETDEFNKVHPA